MPSLIDEHTQFTDSDGTPIVNGSVYIGTQNLDPVANAITIYSDRGLTTAISNPQTTDANGRATNKIWVPGKYSIQVNDSAAVQKYQNLDAGELTQTGISQLVNVQGTNTVTAEGSPAITALIDNQQYNFRAANTNTGAITLQIDLTTAKTIKKFHDIDLVAGDIEQNQTVSVIYNATDDTFELVSNIAALSLSNITFPATQAPSANANTLDDYEEGTWTPTLLDSDLNPSEGQTYNASLTGGTYTKIGRLVFITGRIVMTSIGTLTGGQQAQIGGLPFTSATTPAAGNFGAITVSEGNGLAITAGTSVTGVISATSDAIGLQIWSPATGSDALTITNVSANGELYFGGAYHVDT